jgi:hypothetical protein
MSIATDAEHYNYFRDYDPATGRYIESDPIGLEGGLGTYGYVGARPLNLVDTLGLWAQCFLTDSGPPLPSGLQCCSFQYKCRSLQQLPDGSSVAGGSVTYVLRCEGTSIRWEPKTGLTWSNGPGGKGTLTDFQCKSPTCNWR